MRLFVALASVLALAFAAPAVADSPTLTVHHDVFTDINPCTGLEHTLTVDNYHWEQQTASATAKT